MEREEHFEITGKPDMTKIMEHLAEMDSEERQKFTEQMLSRYEVSFFINLSHYKETH